MAGIFTRSGTSVVPVASFPGPVGPAGASGSAGPQGPSPFRVEASGVYPPRGATTEPVIWYGVDNPDTLGLMLPGDMWFNPTDAADSGSTAALLDAFGILLESQFPTRLTTVYLDGRYPQYFTASAALNFPSIAAGATAELTITVTGAEVDQVVMLAPPAAIEAGLVWSGYVSAHNIVTIRLYNSTTSAIDPASGTWRATTFVN